MGGEDLCGLAVGGDGVGGIDDTDRGGIHRGTAVDHIADATEAGIGIGEAEAHEQPLLRVEEAIDKAHRGAALGDPDVLVGDERDDALGEDERIEMVPVLEVDAGEHAGHQGVIGVAAVALAEVGRAVPRFDETLDGAIAIPYLLRGVPFGGCADGIADRHAIEAAAHLAGENTRVGTHSHSFVIP